MIVDVVLPAFLATAVIILLAIRDIRRYSRKGHLPPGPPPLPIVGNVLDIPRSSIGPTFSALTKRYGVFKATSGVMAPFSENGFHRRRHIFQPPRPTDDRDWFYQGSLRPPRQKIRQLLWTSRVDSHEAVSFSLPSSNSLTNSNNAPGRVGLDSIFALMQYGPQWRRHMSQPAGGDLDTDGQFRRRLVPPRPPRKPSGWGRPVVSRECLPRPWSLSSGVI